jgi:hypothetical protein
MMETLKLVEDEQLTREIKQGLAEVEQGKLIPLTDTGNNE